MFKKSLLFIVIAALALTACAPAATQAPPFFADGQAGESGARNAAATAAPAAQEPPKSASGADVDATTTDRLVIQNANLSLVVKDPAAAVDQISALAQSLNGYVVNSNVFQASTDAAGNKIMRANIGIRIPSDKLLTTLAQLEGMTVTGKADSKTISGEDVTAQYTDLESHLRNLEAAEAQLQKIMDGATKTEDVLAVYNQLVYIRDQIEQVKGQMQYYRESAALSLISIDLIPDALSQPLQVGSWQPQGVAKDAIEALVRAFQFLATLGIWGGLFCVPLTLLFGIPGYFIGRAALRRFRKPKPAASA